MQSLVREDMRQVHKRCIGRSRQQRIALLQRKLIQVLPYILLGTLVDKRTHIAGAVDGIVEESIAQLGAGLAHRQEIRRTVCIR